MKLARKKVIDYRRVGKWNQERKRWLGRRDF